MSAMERKTSFVVAFDYGMGGVWATVIARSASEINDKYPEVQVVDEKPQWMTVEEFKEWPRRSPPIDIDAEPSGIFLAILDYRNHA